MGLFWLAVLPLRCRPLTVFLVTPIMWPHVHRRGVKRAARSIRMIKGTPESPRRG